VPWTRPFGDLSVGNIQVECPKKEEKRMRPRMFVGSSTESLKLKLVEAVTTHLTDCTKIIPWPGIFEPSAITLPRLIKATEDVDFALFIFAKDDLVKIRKQEYYSVRDNVLFELGLFCSKIGFERCFLLAPRLRGAIKLRLPTDLLGLNIEFFDFSKASPDYSDALKEPCAKIEKRVKAELFATRTFKLPRGKRKSFSNNFSMDARRTIDILAGDISWLNEELPHFRQLKGTNSDLQISILTDNKTSPVVAEAKTAKIMLKSYPDEQKHSVIAIIVDRGHPHGKTMLIRKIDGKVFCLKKDEAYALEMTTYTAEKHPKEIGRSLAF